MSKTGSLSIIQSIWQSALYRHLFFFLSTVITIFLMGYYFGTFDQVIHIPFLKKFADPSLYPNDGFLDLRFTHYSFFWLFFIPFYKLGLLEISMFLVYLVTTYLTFWGLWSLSKTLFGSPLTSFLTVIVFIFPHLGFAGFSVFQFSLLNRSFVLPFLLFSITLYLNKKYFFSFLLLGLIYNLHVISVNFVIFMFLFDSLLKVKQIGWKKFIVNFSAFIVGALPVLIWKMTGSSVEFGPDWEWFAILNKSVFYFLFNLTTLDPIFLFLTLGGASSVFIFFLALPHLQEVTLNNTVKNFMYSLLLVLGIVVITRYWFPSTIVIQSQIVRAGVFIIIFSYLYMTRYVVKMYQDGSLDRRGFVVFLLALSLSITPLLLLSVLLLYKFVKSRHWYSAGILSVLVFFAVAFSLAVKFKVWRPGIHIFPEPSNEYDVEIWARDNTPKNALFITPPHRWWLYNPEWRTISERSTLVTLYDLLEIAFAPNYISNWKERFEDVAPGALSQFNGNVFANFETTKKAFYTLSTTRLRQLADKYNASYVLVEKPNAYDLPMVYENSAFILYKLL